MLNLKETNNLKNIAKNLISYKSITPIDAGCLEYIQNYLEKLGFTFTRVDKNETCNLIATYGDLSKPIFAFAGHVDVVPTGDISKWDSDPFTLTEINNELYGRGIGDMKGAIASFIIAAEKYITENKNPDKAILILLTSDEEGKGTDGTPIIVQYLKQQNIRINYCVVGEPTSNKIVGDVIKIGRRGSLTAHLTINGTQGHVAYPQFAKNPIHIFADALKELSQTPWDQGTEFFPPTSLQFTNINAGLGVDNVTPEVLHAKFNLRFNNIHTNESLREKILVILNKYALQYDIAWFYSAKPFLSRQGKLSLTTANAVRNVMNSIATFKTDGGVSDGRFLIEVSDELLELGLSNQYIHQISERIHKDDLAHLANIYYQILMGI